MHTVQAFSIFHSSLIILVVAIILLDLFAKPLSVKLAEIITVSFIQFLTLLKSMAAFLDQVFILQKTNSSYCTVTYTACSCLFIVHLPSPSLLQDDDDGPLGAPEYDTISENGLMSRNEPIRSKVSKLTEKLRKRYPTTSTGQSSLTHPLFFPPPYSSSVIKEESVSYLGSELAFYFIFHNTISLCLVLQRQLF